MSNVVDILIAKEARDEIRLATKDMEDLVKQIIEAKTQVKAFSGQTMPNPVPSSMPKVIGETSKFLSDLNAQYREAEKLAGTVARKKAELSQAESTNARTVARLREETRLNNAVLKEEGILSSKLLGSFKKLETSRNRQARILRDLLASEKASNREIRIAQKEFDKLDRKVKSINRSTNNFRENVGNYGSAFGKASAALRSFIGVLGIYSATQVAQDIYEQVKAINGLTLALQQVTDSEADFIRAQEFVSRTAEESGAEIFGLTNSYVKFLASAKTTNLTAEETENIFRQTAKAAGVLGLTADSTRGVFVAFEQILSKGKVQAEEIRGQLGERLPGAFQILASSMGLTTQQLSKQLELGKVISEEVLPGFANGLAKTYSLETVQRVETLAASQTRLGNAWKKFVADVEGSEGAISSVFKSLLETFTAGIEFLQDLNKTVEETREEFEKGLRSEAMKEEMNDLKIESIKTGRSMEQTARLIRSSYIYAMQDTEKALSDVNQQFKDQKAALDSGEIGWREYIDTTQKLKEEEEALNNSLVIKLGKLDAVNKVLKVTTKSTKDYNEEVKNGIVALKGSIGFLENTIAKLKEKQNKLATTTTQYRLFGQAIREAEAELLKLNATLGNQKVGIKSPDNVGSDQAAKNLSDILLKIEEDRMARVKEMNDALQDDLEAKAKDRIFLEKYVAEEIKKVYAGVFDTFQQYYGVDMTAFTKLLMGKKASLEDYVSTAKGFADTLTQSRIIGYENELQTQRMALEQLENNEEASDKQKKIAKQKFAKEEAEIRTKQAKAERDAALFKIAIDTATAIAKILTTAATLASNPITAPFAPNAFVQASIAGGVGLAQAAFVLAQPLPKFAKGTDNAPEGPAITDEEGRELHLDKNNRIKDLGSDKGARVKSMAKGDKILPAGLTKSIMGASVSSNNDDIQDKIDLWLMRTAAAPTIPTDGIERTITRAIGKFADRPNVIYNVIEKDLNEFS